MVDLSTFRIISKQEVSPAAVCWRGEGEEAREEGRRLGAGGVDRGAQP